MFSNPGEFYIQVSSPEVLSNIRKLSMKLKDHYESTQEEYSPGKGEVCVAKHSVDQVTWFACVFAHGSSKRLIYFLE